MKLTSENGTVTLLLGGREQSVWRKDNPDYLVSTYLRLVALASLTWSGYVAKRSGRALIVGLGGGVLCRFLSRHFPHLAIEVVEPSRSIANIARKHFALDSKVLIHEMGGREFLTRSRKTFDMIILDAFDEVYVPREMMTVEFLRTVKRRLHPAGVLIANTWVLRDITKHENATYASVFRTLWDFRLLPNIDGNRVLLYNSAAGQDLAAVRKLVLQRAQRADERNPLKSAATKNQMYYSGLTERLRILEMQPQRGGMILTDANIPTVRRKSSFDV